MSEQIQDAEVVEGTEAGREIVPIGASAVTTPLKASDLVARLDTIKDAMSNAMQEDVDYGVIPGTTKPTLLKPGAEKLAVLFELDIQTTHDERWGPGDHLTVPAKTIVYHAPTGTRRGSGEGMCSTRERKYAYRRQERTCPKCGAQAIIKGKAEYGGGWLCWKKKDGCNAKFADGDESIESQQAGDVENPDLPDLWNTVIKMARKRALIDAVLLVTGASALFTQDVEDAASGTERVAEPEPRALPYGVATPEKELAVARQAIAYLLDPGGEIGPDDNRVALILGEVEAVTEKNANAAGYAKYLPAIALGPIVRVARAARRAREGTQDMGDPAQETAEEREDREHAEQAMAVAEEVSA